MKLKFAPFCSPSDVLLHGIIVCRNQNFQFLAENNGLESRVLVEIEDIFLRSFGSSLEGAMTRWELISWELIS